mmetsp:Transcript_12004/g.30040  ORF Transcript_12004/g.30040 Transcript_12004/m.30040 type:complete len:212 (-) Transcript_12004:1964-2599(-)
MRLEEEPLVFFPFTIDVADGGFKDLCPSIITLVPFIVSAGAAAGSSPPSFPADVELNFRTLSVYTSLSFLEAATSLSFREWALPRLSVLSSAKAAAWRSSASPDSIPKLSLKRLSAKICPADTPSCVFVFLVCREDRRFRTLACLALSCFSILGTGTTGTLLITLWLCRRNDSPVIFMEPSGSIEAASKCIEPDCKRIEPSPMGNARREPS